MIESNISGQASVNGVISEKHYNKSVYCHKIVSEALHRVRFQAFLDCLEDEDSTHVATLVSDLLEEFPGNSFLLKVKEDTFMEIMTVYNDFISQACDENPTFARWSNYLEMVEILLCFTRYNFM